MDFQRAADGASAVFQIMTNGLMRATRKIFYLVGVDEYPNR